MSDRILGGVSLALALFFVYQATQLPLSFMTDPVGPKTFPIIVAAILGLAGLVVLLRPDPDPAWPGAGRIAEIGAAAFVLAVYAFALPEIGFLAATAVASAYLSWRLGSHPLTAVLAGVVISAGIYAIFHLVLGLSLARGPWGF
jgi:putative tricarboxylic transport membrane protein